MGPSRAGQKAFQCKNCSSWGHIWWGCLTLGNLDWRGLNWAEHPPDAPTQTPSRNTETISKSGMAKQSDHYHNLDPLYHLLGDNNESEVVVDGQSFLALIDLGSQVLTITQDLAGELQLPAHILDTFLSIEGIGGQRVPYTGYFEA